MPGHGQSTTLLRRSPRLRRSSSQAGKESNPPAAAAMAAVEVPTLAVNGTGTWPVLRTAAVELARVLPNGRHVEVPASDHDIPVPETAALIHAFAG